MRSARDPMKYAMLVPRAMLAVTRHPLMTKKTSTPIVPSAANPPVSRTTGSSPPRPSTAYSWETSTMLAASQRRKSKLL